METKSQKEKVKAILNSIENGNREAMEYINPKKFIQHNLSANDGLEGFGEVIAKLSSYPEPAKVNVIRVFSDGEYTVAHTEYNFFGEKTGFDIFRFEHGKAVEHWDNLQEKPKNNNPSNRSTTDGPTEITDIDKTAENRALITIFADDILIGGNFQNIASYFNGNKYIQHNPLIGDGVYAFGTAIAEMKKDGIDMTFERVHKVLCEGNFALVISEGRFGADGGVPTSYYDLFRIENGKIAEHWDVIENIVEPSNQKNSNGKFGF